MIKRTAFIAVALIIFVFAASAHPRAGEEDRQRKFTDETVKEENAAKRYGIDVTYPALAERSAQAGAFNNAVKKHIDGIVGDFRKILGEMTDEDRSFLPEGVDYTLDLGYEIDYEGEDVISVSFGRSTYTGGAHPNHWTTTINFDMRSGKEIELASIFKPGGNYLKVISDYCVADIIAQQETDADEEWVGRGAGPDAENFRSWSVTNEGLKFYFDPYQVGPYAAGPFEVTMPYEKIPAEVRSDNFYTVEKTSYVGGNPPNWCRGGHFPQYDGGFGLMRVNGGKDVRAYFYGDDDDCPNGENCRKKAYVIGGDTLVVSRTYGDFVCAWYQPLKGPETVGWMRMRDVYPLYEPEGFHEWIGEWTYGESDLTISSAGGDKFSVKGNAFWKGLGDNIHIGEVDEQGTPVGDTLSLGGSDEYDCKVKLRIIFDYLIVTDNKNCGGVNVSFDGVYRRKK